MNNMYEEWTKKYQERLKKKIEKRRTEMTSYMNNTKWKKLFNALNNSGVNIIRPKCNSLDCDDREELYDICLNIPSYTDEYTEDSDGACPTHLKEIVYIIIRVSEDKDINILKNAIDKLGLYEYEILEKAIRIYGYK